MVFMTGNTPLQTDLYQLTMGYGYWKNGMAERKAVFHHYFRTAPFDENCVIVAGLADALEWLKEFKFNAAELSYLAGLTGSDGEKLFDENYLNYLRKMELSVTIWAIPEGELAYANEPLIRVEGPLIQCQLLETALLNIVNFQTLVATQAARICEAAKVGGNSNDPDDEVLEFGLRRAQGPDGGLSASRAAYVGGVTATSNVLAGYRYGIPVRGTHAHSWVMSFEDELESFEAYAAAMPNNCVLLVDTYDTLEGVKKAIVVAKKLQKIGHELAGVRLDSGDLCELSIGTRKLLDEAGLANVKVVASDNLDAAKIRDLKSRGAKIQVWGVGTKLVTAYEQPALGGVYKLSAIEDECCEWRWKMKLGNEAKKMSMPGILQVRREGEYEVIFHDPSGEAEGKLIKVVAAGKVIMETRELSEIRDAAIRNWQGEDKNLTIKMGDVVSKMQTDYAVKRQS